MSEQPKTMKRACARCGKHFQAKKSGNRWYQYCSIECTREMGKAIMSSGGVLKSE